jgi:TPR repeat protein
MSRRVSSGTNRSGFAPPLNGRIVRRPDVILRHIELLREKLRALLGDANACHRLGARYATGDHGEWVALPNPSSAVRWYERGAKRGDPHCQYDLGFMYILGEGAPQDRQAGLNLVKRAAAQGYCEAIRVLADCFSSGAHGVVPDPDQARYWSRVLSDHLIRHPEDKRLYER